MDAERNGRPMTLLEAIDRDLRAALAVEPSPEFVARVRARIAAEPRTGSWPSRRGLWAGAGLVAASLALAIIVFLTMMKE